MTTTALLSVQDTTMEVLSSLLSEGQPVAFPYKTSMFPYPLTEQSESRTAAFVRSGRLRATPLNDLTWS